MTLLTVFFLFALPSWAQVSVLHEFNGGTDDGENPYGDLAISGSTLYGMTYWGGDNGKGTIFKIGTSGSDFTLLHEFAGGSEDGAFPVGSLVISGTTIYGITVNGGDSVWLGTIFKIETDGSNFTLLHEFTGGADDGAKRIGKLVLSGATLYGMTDQGGDGNFAQYLK